MIKLKALTVVAAMLFAASAYAGDKGKGGACCVKGASHDGKDGMSLTYANLNLTPDQKTKLQALEADCNKAGCTKESTAKFMKGAEGILSKEQFAEVKAACEKHCAKKEKKA